MNQDSVPAPRGLYVSLAVGTIALGLLLQVFRHRLPAAFGDILGDALWAAMIFWLVSAAAPEAAVWKRGLVAVVVCWVVEFSQLYQAPRLTAWRETTLGRLTLGSGFDPRDLVAYVLGVLGAVFSTSAARLRGS